MGCRFASTALISEVSRIVALVGTDGDAVASRNLFDHIQCGFPLFAEGQMGALMPLNLLMFALLPFKRW